MPQSEPFSENNSQDSAEPDSAAQRTTMANFRTPMTLDRTMLAWIRSLFISDLHDPIVVSTFNRTACPCRVTPIRAGDIQPTLEVIVQGNRLRRWGNVDEGCTSFGTAGPRASTNEFGSIFTDGFVAGSGFVAVTGPVVSGSIPGSRINDINATTMIVRTASGTARRRIGIPLMM
jgi:hypothetical protein